MVGFRVDDSFNASFMQCLLPVVRLNRVVVEDVVVEDGSGDDREHLFSNYENVLFRVEMRWKCGRIYAVEILKRLYVGSEYDFNFIINLKYLNML